MKTYKATFWRSNPQLKSGGYETTIEIVAETKAEARRKARKIEKGALYGGLCLRDITNA